jgi:hypothetical protein
MVRVFTPRNWWRGHRRWAWLALVWPCIAVAVAFAAPFNFSPVWKGLIASVGVLAGVVQTTLERRKAGEQVTGHSRRAQKRAREQLLKRLSSQWIEPLLDTPLFRPSFTPRLKEVRGKGGSESLAVVHVENWEGDLLSSPGSYLGNMITSANSILLLGVGGGGKTTLLAIAARQLAQEADRDAGSPLPVMLRLAGWAGQSKVERNDKFRDWIIEEIGRYYHIPRSVVLRWLIDGDLTLILDGLNEISGGERNKFIEDANQFVQSYGLNRLLISSRPEEYQSCRQRLDVEAFIETQPLNKKSLLAEIDENLEGESSRSLFHDPELVEVLDTPLMASLAFELDRGHAEIDSTGGGVARRAMLFDRYLDIMLSRGSQLPGGSVEGFRSRLRWLAKRGDSFSRTDLNTLWLAPGLPRRAATLGLPVVVGLLAGIICYGSSANLSLSFLVALVLAVLLVPDKAAPTRRPETDRDIRPLVMRDPLVALLAALACGSLSIVLVKLVNTQVILAAGGALALLLLLLALFWDPHGLGSPLEVDRLLAGVAGLLVAFSATSLSSIVPSWWGKVLLSIIAAFSTSLLLCLIYFLVEERFRSPLRERVLLGVSVGRAVAIIILPCLLLGALISWLTGISALAVTPAIGAAVTLLAEAKFIVIHSGGRCPELYTSAVTPLGGMIAGGWLGWQAGLAAALLGMILFVVAYWNREGDALPPLKRLVVHGTLALRGDCPWRLSTFLEAARVRLILRKVGGRYEFLHPLLRQHLGEE